jgi:hypothetical protein
VEALFKAAKSPGVQALINDLYHRHEVRGIALGVHAKFVSLLHEEYGTQISLNDVLLHEKIPRGWSEVCSEAGYQFPMSPIYVVIWVTPEHFTAPRFSFSAPAIGPYAIFFEAILPFIGSGDRQRHRPLIGGGISIGHGARKDSGHLVDFVAITALRTSCSSVVRTFWSTSALCVTLSNRGLTMEVALLSTQLPRFCISHPYQGLLAGRGTTPISAWMPR